MSTTPKKKSQKQLVAEQIAALEASKAALTEELAQEKQRVANLNQGQLHAAEQRREIDRLLKIARDALGPIKTATDKWDPTWPEDGIAIIRPLTFGQIKAAAKAAVEIGAVPAAKPGQRPNAR